MNKVVKRIIIILLILKGIFAAVIGFFAIKGAVLWGSTRKRLSVEQAAKEIRSSEEYAKLEELPEFYINAVISVEDRRFYKHSGLSLKSVIRAAFYDLKERSFEQGGSTITQQLAKNIWFTQEKDIARKFAELYASFALERELSKDDILELYVNSIYFGSGYYGVESAARGYFGKSVPELTEYECAMLAGIPNAPSVYSPDESPELARQRLEQVLRSMVDNDMLSDEDMKRIIENA